jgi:cytochrome P450
MTEQILADAAKAPVLDDEKLPENTAVTEVGSWASRMTLDIIGVAGLGRSFNAIHDPDNELNQTYRTILAPTKQARILDILSILVPGPLVSSLPLKRNGTISHAADFIRQTCRDMIEEKKAKLANNKLHDLDILSVALESGGFSDENLVDQLMTFLAAGHETTASAMTWAIYMLCLHQDVQSRLRDEVRSHLPSLSDDAAEVTSQMIDHLPYLNAFCNEVLRYYAPAPITIREAAVDTTICDHYIPKGTRVMIHLHAINRSKALWGEDADKFCPDRWLPRFEGDKGAASGHATSNYAFMTFLHGPRSCIGQAFAKAEFACLVAAWVGRLQFEIRDKALLDEKNMVMKGRITRRPWNGMWVKATVLDGW